MTLATLKIGTRGSALALAQAGDIARAITDRTGIPTELIPVTTHGDITRESLSSLGGTGVFASALREFMLRGECDLVVHSMKDLPTIGYPGLSIGAVPERADARDALCARDGLALAELPAGARVGTGSPRRAAQVRRRRPDVTVHDIRGNVDTRLGFVHSGELDAVILAVAGLSRLRRDSAITEKFDLDSWPGAPAQGALALEVRTESLEIRPETADIRAALSALNDPVAHAAAVAERAVLSRLEAGCAAPIGAYAAVEDGELILHASVYAPTGMELRSAERTLTLGSDPLNAADGLGRTLAEDLLAAGAAEIAPLN